MGNNLVIIYNDDGETQHEVLDKKELFDFIQRNHDSIEGGLYKTKKKFAVFEIGKCILDLS